MSRTLYVHVGPPKTGTSAIQYVLQNHDNSVIIYPKVGLWAGGSHHNLVFNFYGDAPKVHHQAKEDISLLFEQIGREARKSPLSVLISSEWLARRKDVGLFVRNLMPYLESTPLEVEILFMCREHFERAASLYSHGLKGWEKRDPDEFLQEETTRFCYAPMARELLNTGFKVTPLNYHPSDDCVARFLKYVGFSANQIFPAQNRNVAFNTKGLVATLAANRVVQSKQAKRMVRLGLTRMPEAFAPSRFVFGRTAAKVAERVFSADRIFLEDEFGIELPARNLDLEQNNFLIDRDELGEIAIAVRDTGPDADAIVKIASRYLRD